MESSLNHTVNYLYGCVLTHLFGHFYARAPYYPGNGDSMKILLWILAIIFLIGLLVVTGVFSLVF